MAVTLKIKFREETRRITVEELKTYQFLVETLDQLFPDVKGKYTVKYVDPDEDLITLSSDKELEEAIKLNTSGVLRIHIAEASNSQTEKTVPQPSANSNTQPNPTSDVPFNPLLNLLSSFGQTPPSNVNANQPPFNFANLFNPQPQQQQQQQQQTPGIPPFLQSLLSNPQTAQMIPQLLPQFLPMLLNLFQNAQPEQKQQVLNLLEPLSTNPQVLNLVPQLPQILATLKSNNTSQPQQQQQFQNPFADLAKAFAQTQSSSNSTSSSSAFSHQPEFYCDICENAITGIRYNCNTCSNYDLCDFCHTIPDVHDGSHTFSEVHVKHH